MNECRDAANQNGIAVSLFLYDLLLHETILMEYAIDTIHNVLMTQIVS